MKLLASCAFFLCFCSLPVTQAQPAQSSGPAPISDLDHFDFVVGTQIFSPAYQFTSKTALVEAAETIHDLGYTVIKFALGPHYYDSDHPLKANHTAKSYIPKQDPAIQSLVQLARDEPSHRHVLDMPFAYYVIWMHTFSNPGTSNWREGFSKEAQAREYREVYDLVAWLLKTYSGTGKTFYLGHWEGDGMLRGRLARNLTSGRRRWRSRA